MERKDTWIDFTIFGIIKEKQSNTVDYISGQVKEKRKIEKKQELSQCPQSVSNFVLTTCLISGSQLWLF